MRYCGSSEHVLQLEEDVIAVAQQGRSLLPLLARPDTADSQRVAYAYLGGDGVLTEVESVIAEHLKLIRYLKYDRPHAAIDLYDRTADPREAHNLAAERPVEVGYLRTQLQRFGFSLERGRCRRRR